MIEESIIDLADSYKYSQYKQYPKNMVSMFDYAEARSGKVYPATVFFGLQYYIDAYLAKPITLKDVDRSEANALAHGIPFNRSGWEHIIKEHDGYMPVKIRAVREGTLVPVQNALFTIESTDPQVPWVAGFLETILMKVWYPSNVATRSYYVKQTLQKFWEKTVDDDEQYGINFAYHNFGDRGSSSVESAGIGGMAHLTQFMGTDNFNSLRYAQHYYNADMAGFSIPATEHSSTTAWGKDDEFKMIMTHIEDNKGQAIIAAVCDSYDYLATVREVTSGSFKEKIESDDYPKFIIRPDSGDPEDMVIQTLAIMLANGVQYDRNEKGYIVFKKYGILWGDGIDNDVIEKLLIVLEERKFAVSNIAFGSGGWLMQQHDRDTQGWAVKCSSITVDEGSPIETGVEHEGKHEMVWEDFFVERDVFKDPITAPNKKSKKGRLTLTQHIKSGEYATLPVDSPLIDDDIFDIMDTVYEDGRRFNKISFNEVKA